MGTLGQYFGMWLLNRKKKTNEKTTGYIGYYSLEDWWNNEFTEEEQKYMIEKYQPEGSSGDLLTSLRFSAIAERQKLDGLSKERSAVRFLMVLSTWFNNKSDLHLAEKITSKANALLKKPKYNYANKVTKSNEIILDEYYLQMNYITIYYRRRENPIYLDKAIKACNKQIELGEKAIKAFKVIGYIPSHTGFKQLAIILEKQKKYDEAIKLCIKAKKQGWGGDWDKRIERYSKKLNKASK